MVANQAPKGRLAYILGLARRRVVQGLNMIDRLRRKWAYGQTRTQRTRLVAQGDSWFCYPLWTRQDMLWHLQSSLNYAVRTLAGAGRTSAKMVTKAELAALRRLIETERPAAVLLSAGGNDLLHIMNMRPARARDAGLAFVPDPEGSYIHDSDVKTVLAEVEENLHCLIQTARDAGASKIILVGYDYPNVGNWTQGSIHQSLQHVDAPCAKFQQIADALLDRLFAVQRRVAEAYAEVIYMPLTGVCGDHTDWKDEAHPHTEGFLKAAQHLVGNAEFPKAERG